MKMFMILLAHSDGVFIYFLQLEKGTGGGRSFGFFNKDPEQAKQDKRGRVDSNIEEVSKGPGGGGVGSGERGNLPYGNACRLNNGVHDETPLILAVKCVRVHSKK